MAEIPSNRENKFTRNFSKF